MQKVKIMVKSIKNEVSPKIEKKETSKKKAPGKYSVAGYIPKTPFGCQLLDIRSQMTASGIPFLSRDETEKELADRRGGHS